MREAGIISHLVGPSLALLQGLGTVRRPFAGECWSTYNKTHRFGGRPTLVAVRILGWSLTCAPPWILPRLCPHFRGPSAPWERRLTKDALDQV